MNKRRTRILTISLLMIVAMMYIFICTVFAETLVPNGEEYFKPDSTLIGPLLGGILRIAAIVIAAIGTLGIVFVAIYVGCMMYKVLWGKDMGKQTWKTAGTTFLVFALLSTGGWYGIFETANKVGVSKAKEAFTKEAPSQGTTDNTKSNKDNKDNKKDTQNKKE